MKTFLVILLLVSFIPLAKASGMNETFFTLKFHKIKHSYRIDLIQKESSDIFYAIVKNVLICKSRSSQDCLSGKVDHPKSMYISEDYANQWVQLHAEIYDAAGVFKQEEFFVRQIPSRANFIRLEPASDSVLPYVLFPLGLMVLVITVVVVFAVIKHRKRVPNILSWYQFEKKEEVILYEDEDL